MTHHLAAGPAAFLASFVEFIEALTVVLAVGVTRGWRNALTGAGLAVAILAAVLTMVEPRDVLPSPLLRLLVGVLTLMFGLRWLRKAILRAAGVIPLHDEVASYAGARARLASDAVVGWDGVALIASFQVVAIEGLEVALIVAAVGAGGGAFVAAAWGAGAALLVVVGLGLILHRPITQVPENTLKCGVGIMLCAFGTFWAGEAMGATWPGGEWALPSLSMLWALCAVTMIRVVRT